MFLLGKKIQKFLEGIGEEAVQPAGVDLTLEKVFTFTSRGEILNNTRKISEVEEVEFNGEIHLPPGAYKVRFGEIISIPKDAVGFCFPRSSLLRCGATLECAVWDPGYKGKSEALLLVFNPKGVLLEKRARIGQLVMAKVSGKAQYKGKYQGENLK